MPAPGTRNIQNACAQATRHMPLDSMAGAPLQRAQAVSG